MIISKIQLVDGQVWFFVLLQTTQMFSTQAPLDSALSLLVLFYLFSSFILFFCFFTQI